MTLQKYKSHKTVLAGKIQGIRTEERVARPIITALVVGGHEYPVPENFNARGSPEIGDYLVQYEDGYLSWSPAKAFEDGCTLVEEMFGGPYLGTMGSPLHEGSGHGDDVQQDGSVDPAEVGDRE